MSFKTSSNKSTSNTSANSSFDRTTTPVLPEWLTGATQGIANHLGDLRNVDPLSRVSPSNAWIEEAAGRAANLGRSDPWEQEAGSMAHATYGAAAPQVAAASLLDNFKSYESPYIRSVVDAALADYDYGAAKTRAQQALDLSRQGAFGGSGAALARSFTEGELNRGRASTSATLRDQGFNRAAQLADQDAARRQAASEASARFAAEAQQRNLSAAQLMAQISNQHAANSRADIGVIGDIGQTLRGIDTQQRQAPWTAAGQDIDLLTGLPLQLFAGSNEQGTAQSSGTSSSKSKGWDFSADIGDVMSLMGLPGGGVPGMRQQSQG
jgi:hypothetical protein